MSQVERKRLEKFRAFYRRYYEDAIAKLAQRYPTEQRSLYVAYDDLFTYDAELAQEYLDRPVDTREIAEEALRTYDLPADVSLGQAHVRVRGLPASSTIDIRNIRVVDDHIGSMVAVQGIVRKATDVRPKIVEAAFECQRCGTMTYIPQSDSGFQEPHECQGCERQGPFRINNDQSEFIDAQTIRVQESPEGLRGGETPQSIDVYLEDDVCGEVTPGDHVSVAGVLHIEQQVSGNEKTALFDLYMDGVAVTIEDEEFEDMEISDEDVTEILELADTPDIYETMVDSVAPSIYGYDQEKLAMILQLFGGVTKHLPDESRIRGDLHMLLIGDPGTGKCVHGDTPVTLADGSEVPIRDLVESNLDDPDPVDDGVYDDADILVSSLASDGELTERTATRVWKREAPERLIRVRTASGREIEVTPSHPLFVSADGTFEPRRADELDRGSFVATPQYRPSGHDNELRAEYRRSESGNAVHIDAPDEWTPWFARFLGYVVAEGYVEQNPDNTGSIFVTNNDQAVLDDVSDALEKLNAPHSVRSPNEDREAREIVCTAGELVSLLENIEPAVLRPSAEQRVPDQLFGTGDDVRRAFLRAYVEGEGHVSTRQRSLTVGSMSRELLEGVRSLLLSFGVGSTLESRQNGSYRLRISGESFVRFRERIGLVSERKREALRRHEGVETNTNVDVIPNVGQELERIRSQLGLSQSGCGVPRATYQHYERGDRQPSLEGLTAVIEAFEERLEWLDEVRDHLVKCDWDVLEDVRSELNVSQGEVAAATGVTQGSISGYERGDVSPDGGVTDEARRALLGVVDEAASVEEDVQSLRRLVEADVRWDEVVSLEWVEHDEDWVYDLEVRETHSYVSDGVVSHNSQLLSYTQNIAPRSVYTSGKGSSAAGLCVTGDTLVHTADGIRRADDLVTPEIPESVETETAVEREYDVYTYDEAAGETTVASTSHVWRMPPKPCRRIETASGTELETSQNTPVLTCGDDGLEWKSMSEVEAGDHVATPTFDGIERSSPPVSEFIEYTNEKLLLTDDSVECLRDSLTEKFGTLRDAAAALDFSEDFVYDTLSNRHVPVEKLDRIVSETPTDWGDIDARRAMLRHGEGVEIPTEFDADLMYLLGLTYGDGDIAVSRRDENRGMVRISNSDEALLRRAVDIIESVFDKEVEIERQEDRVACIRLHSATIARLFHNVGMSTPKTGLSLDDRLTTAEHADAFLRGLMDADGSVSKRDDGGSSVHFSTISERLARQVRAMLHTYDVQARIRERDRRGTSTLPDGHTIESKHVQYHVEVYGSDLDRYAECVGFGSETKRAVLDRITGETPRRGERLPVGSQLAAADVPVAGSYHNVVVRGDDLSRERAVSMQQELDLGEAASLVESVTGSNLRWDEVVAAVDTGRKELYDLTVPGTNNFVADGVITHNTAAAVRDDFGDGQQWTLEAGALVLADKGIAAVDELDKMRCVTGDTLVTLDDGRVRRIAEIARDAADDGEVESLSNGRTIRDVDCGVWTMDNDGSIVRRPVTAIHEYEAPETLTEVTLESGESVTATDDHPFFVFEDGERRTCPAADLEPGQWTYVPRSLPSGAADGGVVADGPGSGDGAVADGPGSSATDSGVLSPAMGAILGYLSGDGHVFHERETGSYSLRFTNTEEELLSDFEVACRRAFDAEPTRPESGQRDGGVESVHLYGKEYVEAVLDAGMNLETYDRKAFPSGVSGGSRETKAAFVRALANSEGHVDTATGNVRIASASEELLSGAKQLLLEFGVSAQIQTDPREEKRDLHSLAITDADSLEAFAHHVGFTLDRKERALEAVVSDASGDRTILDVVPEVGPILRSIRTDLRLYQSECGLDDATYCNFERGDANISIHRAETVLTRFEERIERAERDRQRLTDDQSWETIAELKDRYHFSQSELAEETSFTQQQVSRKWGDSRQLRDRLAERLQACLDEISAVDPSELERVIRADVKWRRVETVTGVRAEQTDDRTPILRAKLADVLGCDTDEAVEAARTVLDHELSTETWSELDDELDQFGVSYQSLADDLGVAGSTVSRWFSGAVETDRLDDVRAAAVERFSTKLNRVRALVDEIERDSSPRVYDLTVDETHNFVANGMVVHNSEDRSAMHEALEQQSYHPDEEILLADGRRVEIGEFVDRAMDRRADDVVDGVDCEILSLDDTRIHSVDMETNEVTKCPVDRVSRHEAPDEFVRVAFSNGRSVTVTPDHPMFVDDGGVETVTASSVEEGDFVPAPRVLPNSTASVPLSPTEQAEGEKIVQLPEEMSPNLAEILGFLTAEGHSCAGSAHEIGFSNQDERLLARMDSLFQRVFGIESTDTTNAAGTVTKRWISTKLYRWFQSNFPEVMQTARNKRVPAAVLGASTEEVRRYLVGAFAGDGSVESESMALSTASSGLAEDYADALAKLGVATRLHHDPAEDSWKTYVMGDSIPEFVDAVVEPTDDRYQDAVDFAERSERTPRHHDVLPPSAAEEIRDLRRRLGLGLTGQLKPNIDEGFGVRIETVEEQVATLRRRVSNISDRLHEADSLEELRDLVGWSGRQLAERLDSETTSAVHYAENGGYDAERRQSLLDRSVTAVRETLDSATTRLAALEDRCELRYYEVTEVETVPNEGEHATEWVYDVTVEPTNTFVSDGVVLHNSISISKAGINATLRSRCSLLGAANPKYGRFDQYEPIGEQIDLEPALISRFDLIFTVTDQPDPDEDARLAEHILTTNYAGELNTQQTEMTNSEVSRQQVEEVQETVAPAVDAELLRKYVAYAKRNCYPRMTDAAREAIRDFYVDLRSKGLDEDSPVPVTARQLEAIVRLAEASARVRLSDEVTAADAERVIEIVRSCLEDIGIDPETGEFDADVVETGTTKSQRDRIKGVKELLRTVDEEYEDEPGAPRDQVMKRADEEGMERSKVEKEIERLREKGDVYTPDGDHIKLV